MADARRLVETRPTGHERARGLVSSRKSGRRVEAHAYAPSDDLRDVVATLWSGRWDLDAPHVTELVADPCVNLVCELGGPHDGSRIVGVWTRLWRRELRDRGRVRGVKLRAGAVRAFVPVPAFELSNRITPLRSIFADADELARAVLAPDDDAEAFPIFERWLRAARSSVDVALVVSIIERIAADPEITTVEQLAAVAGFGPRALQRLFREHVGASPKWVIRSKRLQEVALRLERGDGPTLAALAAELGYTDQAHLARDFKSVVGKAPSEFAASVND